MRRRKDRAMRIYYAVYRCEISGAFLRCPIWARDRDDARSRATDYPYEGRGTLFIRIEP